MFVAKRYHDISTGHRVHGHENKCRHLHGHNYRIHFHCRAVHGVEALDKLGRVIDFGVIKEKLCMWVEDNWDHKFLAWTHDHIMRGITELVKMESNQIQDYEVHNILGTSVVWTPFNPTAENMAEHLVRIVGPAQLADTGVELIKVVIEETAKCAAEYEL